MNSKINALKAKTKYKITKLRIGMKEHIFESLKKHFTKEQLELPMISFMDLISKSKEKEITLNKTKIQSNFAEITLNKTEIQSKFAEIILHNTELQSNFPEITPNLPKELCKLKENSLINFSFLNSDGIENNEKVVECTGIEVENQIVNENCNLVVLEKEKTKKRKYIRKSINLIPDKLFVENINEDNVESKGVIQNVSELAQNISELGNYSDSGLNFVHKRFPCLRRYKRDQDSSIINDSVKKSKIGKKGNIEVIVPSNVFSNKKTNK